MAELNAENRQGTITDGGIEGWLVVLGSHVCCVVMYGTFQAIGPLLVAIQQYYEESSFRVSGVLSLMLFLQFGSAPLANVCVKKIGYRQTVALGTAISSTGYLLSAFSPNVDFLYFSFGILVGLGYGLLISPACGIIALFMHRRFALANAIAVLGAGVGTFIFPPILQALIDAYGWRGAVVVFSAINAHMFISAALFRQPRTARMDTKEGDGTGERQPSGVSGVIWKLVHLFDCSLYAEYPMFVVTCITAFTIGFGYYGAPAHLVARAKVWNLGNPQEIAWIASATGIGSIIGRLTVPLILHWNFRRVTSARLFGMTVFTAGVAHCLSSQLTTYASYIAYAFALGFVSGMIFVLYVQVPRDMMKPALLTAALSLCLPFDATGGLLGPICAGIIYDTTGDYNNSFYLYGTFLLVGGAVMVISEPIITGRQKSVDQGKTTGDINRYTRTRNRKLGQTDMRTHTN